MTLSSAEVPDLSSELRGPRAVRGALGEFYRVFLPVHGEACRAYWSLSDAELPLPVSKPDDPRVDAYYDRMPEAIDRWPLLAVTTGRAVQRGAVDHEYDGSLVYRTTYPVRVYAWVKDEGFDATQNMRDDLATVVRITTLAHTRFAGSGVLELIPSTVVTDFSELTKVKGERYVAAAYVGFDVVATETLTDRLALPAEQPRDTVSTVNVTAGPLPPIPALP